MGVCGSKKNSGSVTLPTDKTTEDATVTAPQEPNVQGASPTDVAVEESAIQSDVPSIDEATANVVVDATKESMTENHGGGIVPPAEVGSDLAEDKEAVVSVSTAASMDAKVKEPSKSQMPQSDVDDLGPVIKITETLPSTQTCWKCA